MYKDQLVGNSNTIYIKKKSRYGHGLFLLDYGFCSLISKGGRAKNKKKIRKNCL